MRMRLLASVNLALEPIADLDARLVLLRRHDYKRAVVLALLANPPVAAELIAVIFDCVALQRFDGDDSDLAAAELMLVAGEDAVELALGPRRTARPASSTTRLLSVGNSGAASTGLSDSHASEKMPTST